MIAALLVVTAFVLIAFPSFGADWSYSSVCLSIGISLFGVSLAIKIFRNQAVSAQQDVSRHSETLSDLETLTRVAGERAKEARNASSEVLSLIKNVQSEKSDSPVTEEQENRALEAFVSANRLASQVLWVDDNQGWIQRERHMLSESGVATVWVRCTEDALMLLEGNSFDLVITDMGRAEGEREGYVLLDAMRSEGDLTPLVVYSGSNDPKHIEEVYEHGGQGATNNPVELFTMVMKQLGSVPEET